MELGNSFSTEILMSNTRMHALYLRRVLSMLGSELGMDRREIDDVERAIGQVCIDSKPGEPDGSRNVAVRFLTCGTYMQVDIVDPSLVGQTHWSGEWMVNNDYFRSLEKIADLTDGIEVIADEHEPVVRLKKYVGRPHPSQLALELIPSPVAGAMQS
jgi:hypothetical protein